ncbi:MAG: ribosomal RNA small subunit methyltransferase A [Spirochaetes bacterium]|nr:ribosomal RNA small subunit methyltransferase A [Spirochaetota bacterium]
MHFKYFSIKEINNFLTENHLSINKKYGQNFLINSGVVDTIIKNANIQSDDLVIEIGCGLGSLTHKLIATKAAVTGFEIDRAYIKLLKNEYEKHENFRLIQGDFLKKIDDVLKTTNLKKYKRILYFGNLPYNITSPVLEKILTGNIHFNELYFMMQKEVAERIRAIEGSKKYGSLSVFCRFYTDTKIIAKVSPRSFFPEPKVESCIMQFIKKQINLNPLSREYFFKVSRSLFINRRKQLKNNLMMSPFIKNLNNEILIKALKNSAIPPEARGEELSIERIVRLSDEIYKLVKDR